MSKKRTLLIGVIAGLALGVGGAEAQQLRLGGQASLGEDSNFGIGPRVEIGLDVLFEGLSVAGSFDYFFPDDFTFEQGDVAVDAEIDWWELNANLLYAIGPLSGPGFESYVGGGVNFAHVSSDVEIPTGTFAGSTDRVGFNLLGGVRFPLVGITPFVEARIELEGGDQFVVTGGILFP